MQICPTYMNINFTSMFDKDKQNKYNALDSKQNSEPKYNNPYHINALKILKVTETENPKQMGKCFDKNDELAKLHESKNLEYSPVSFLIPLLTSFLTHEISEKEFETKIIKEIKYARFRFSFMPEKEIRNNQRIYSKELKFADSLFNFVKNRQKQDHNKFESTEDAIWSEVVKYNRNPN